MFSRNRLSWQSIVDLKAAVKVYLRPTDGKCYNIVLEGRTGKKVYACNNYDESPTYSTLANAKKLVRRHNRVVVLVMEPQI